MLKHRETRDCCHRIAVEVRHITLNSHGRKRVRRITLNSHGRKREVEEDEDAEEEEEARRRRRTSADIKSNNPHLTGGE